MGSGAAGGQPATPGSGPPGGRAVAHGFPGGGGQLQGTQPVTAIRPRRAAGSNRGHEGFCLDTVSAGIALHEEIRQRLRHEAAGICAPDCRLPRIAGLDHAQGTVRFDALVVAVTCLARVGNYA